MYQAEICIALLFIIALSCLGCLAYARCYMNFLIYGEYRFNAPKDKRK